MADTVGVRKYHYASTPPLQRYTNEISQLGVVFEVNEKEKKIFLEEQPVLCYASLLPIKVQFMFLGMSSGRAVNSLALREGIEGDWLQANSHNLPIDRHT